MSWLQLVDFRPGQYTALILRWKPFLPRSAALSFRRPMSNHTTRRIASLQPNTIVILAEIGEPDRLVGCRGSALGIRRTAAGRCHPSPALS